MLEFKKLENLKIKFESNVDLKKFTYLKTGGIAKHIFYPKYASELSSLITYCNQANIPYKIIGATTNLLFLDDSNYTCLISTIELNQMYFDEVKNCIIAGAGVMLPDLARFALYHSITGFEGLEGIPGTVGGAVFMNAGAYGCEIKDILLFADIVSSDGQEKTFDTMQLKFKKRFSALRTGEINGTFVQGYFKCNPGNPNRIEKKMEVFHAKRHKYQDFCFPSLGSIYSGPVYDILGERDFGYRIVSLFYYLFMYKWKLFIRESPINRKWINDIIVKVFKLNFEIQPFSNKTINCLVNRGQGTNEMLRYITELGLLLNEKAVLENEIVSPF